MNNTTSQAKFRLQDEQYSFPYHYLVDFKDPWPRIRTMRWAWEYFSYVRQIQIEINNLQPKSVLDVGCGDGLLLNTLSGVPVKTGLDLSNRSIQFANAFSHQSEFHLKSVEEWSTPADIVTLVEVIEHIPDDQLSTFLVNASELAQEYLLVSVPTDVIPVTAKHYRHYNEALLIEHTKHLDFDIVWQKRVFKKSVLSKILTRLVCNRLFQINSVFLLEKLWGIFSKYCLAATQKDGVHLIALLKRKTK